MTPEERAVIDAAMKWDDAIRRWLLTCGGDNREMAAALLPPNDRALYQATKRLRRKSK